MQVVQILATDLPYLYFLYSDTAVIRGQEPVTTRPASLCLYALGASTTQDPTLSVSSEIRTDLGPSRRFESLCTGYDVVSMAVVSWTFDPIVASWSSIYLPPLRVLRRFVSLFASRFSAASWSLTASFACRPSVAAGKAGHQGEQAVVVAAVAPQEVEDRGWRVVCRRAGRWGERRGKYDTVVARGSAAARRTDAPGPGFGSGTNELGETAERFDLL